MTIHYRAPEYVADVHATYRAIANRPAALLSVDDRRSVEFYLADIGADPDVPFVVANWTEFIHALDGFVTRFGRLPRADSTRPRPTTDEQILVDRLAYQRRAAVRAAHCSYQTRRLEAVPGFRWLPQQQRWEDQFSRHQQFWANNGRPPRRNAADPEERSLGRWAAHQRGALRDGTLPEDRVQQLRAAGFRVL